MRRLIAEGHRLGLLEGLEQGLFDHGFERVAGVDEVGRGCLAGPVVAAAVIPDPALRVPGVDDSKRLSREQRERIASFLRKSSIAWKIVAVPAGVIDRINILEATRRAMRLALAGLSPAPDCALVDAVSLSDLPFPCYPVLRGDAISYAVAAASILAKVERDNWMREIDSDYPQYGFAKHKGYAAVEHREALAEYGPCPLHRLTFQSVVPRRAEA
jgi:ribonuclease HII